MERRADMNKEKYVAYVSTYTMNDNHGITIYDVDVECFFSFDHHRNHSHLHALFCHSHSQNRVLFCRRLFEKENYNDAKPLEYFMRGKGCLMHEKTKKQLIVLLLFP